MYQALYRKYRPRCFIDVAGQEHVTETLRRQIVSDRLSHAYLFVGTRGTGKTTCAKILSRAINCLAPAAGEPCNKCRSCTGIENGSILDVLELDAASNNGVDNVRALREEAIYTPATVAKRVYIVDEVHMLTPAAFNALLKILEEPPEHLIFILATTELHKVPATILSRCQRFLFKRIAPVAIADRLRIVAKAEGLDLTADAAEKLAALADGSMRDALSLLDQCASETLVDIGRVLDTIGLAGQQEVLRLAMSMANRDTMEALGVLDGLYNDGRDMAALLNELAALLRDVLVYKLSPDSPLLSGIFGRADLSGLSKKLAPERLFLSLKIIRESIIGLSRGGSVKLSVEMCLIRVCDERMSDDPEALLARMARLEGCGVFGVKSDAGNLETDFVGFADNAQSAAVSLPSAGEDAASGTDVIEYQTQTSEADGAQSAVAVLPNAEENAVSGTDSADCESQSTETSPPIESARDAHSQPSALESPKSGFWEDILEQLRNNIPVHALLSDGANVQAELLGSTLIIRAGNLFTISTIESDMFSEPLKEAASKVLGREIIIRVEAGSGGTDETKREKLESLSAFGIVNFE